MVTGNERHRDRRRVLYGRRSGHKLRPHQQETLGSLLPRLSVPLAPQGHLDLTTLFDKPKSALWLEIGFGGGEHLFEQARANPNIGFIGCEPFINGVAKLLVNIQRENIENIRIHADDALVLLAQLPPDSIDRLFTLFPDPWPKKRHHKRRLINEGSLTEFQRVLKPKGEWRFATDIPDYCRWTLAHIYHHRGFRWLANSPSDWRLRPADWPGTRYEAKARREGRVPVYLRFQAI